MRKLAIVGSRKWPDKQAVIDFVNKLRQETVVISGGAPGVDTWAVEAAAARGMATIIIQADWKRFGRSAGIRRNAEIVKQADGLVAFWFNCSPGTMNTLQLANEKHIWNRCYHYDTCGRNAIRRVVTIAAHSQSPKA